MNTKKYIGLDAHSSTCNFCVLNADGVVIDQRKIVTNGRLIRDYVENHQGTLVLAFEECNLSTWLYEMLKKSVKKIVVCNPVFNKQYKKAKTDKLDAYNLANLLRGGFLESVYHDGSEREKFRVLVSGYIDLVTDTTRIQNRHKALFRHSGMSVRGSRVYQESDTRKDKLGEHSRFVAAQQIKQLRQHQKLKESYVNRIRLEIRKFEEAHCIMSLMGIKEIQAAKIISQVINPHRFKNCHKYFAYCGLVKHPRMSAGKQYGSERIWGNRTLKCVYKMAGRSALNGKNVFRDYYDDLRQKGTSEKNAYNAVCRKIAAISLSLWKNMEKFDKEKFTRQKFQTV